MLELEKVTCEQFAACLNQDFAIILSDGALLLQLSEVRPLGKRPESLRDPFALTFVGRAGLRLPQMIYKMRNTTSARWRSFSSRLGRIKPAAASKQSLTSNGC